MMFLLVVLDALLCPNLHRLGADDFGVREAETERCDCLLLALLLPESHPDAEVNYRIRLLRAKWRLGGGIDRMAFRWCFGDAVRSGALFAALPLPPGESGNFLDRPPVPTDFPRFQRYLDTHRYRIAPRPHSPSRP